MFPIIRIIAFTSERKMMTIVVKNPLDANKLYVFTKGADEAIFQLLDPKSANDSESLLQERQVDEFAEQGLRTLVFGMRVLDAGMPES